MPKAKLYRFAQLDDPPQEVELPEEVFSGPVHRDLLWRAVRVYLLNQRQGTAKAKTRGEVAGGGRKPWRQKGVGRARHGSIRSPIWRHGGVTFGPQPGKRRLTLPKKMRRRALRAALAARAQEQRVLVIDSLDFPRPRTKDGRQVLEKLSCPESTLVVLSPQEWEVRRIKSFSNLPRVECVRADSLTTHQVLAHEHLLFTQQALAALVRRLSHA
jgi:large subunit ribosomal protein L4